MNKTTLLLMMGIALVGCGDDGGGRGGGSGDGDGDDVVLGDGDSGGDPSGGDDTDGSSSGADPSGTSSGDGPSGGGTTSGGSAGITCGEIWECYEDCSDIDCTTACYDQGSEAAQALDDELWTCIFLNDCNSSDCIDQQCGAEKQACLDQ